ncbi:Hypothetical predicted protein [Podarcis lilfordi]|uniref:Uncharacterized protein n=1 Tax=Podarcis lilfordi TaxID=74358 RepID=A0AA35NYG3_9SAUR|nr:Hypothetical predicted protein [Podarcis lilfordi]
MAEGDPTLSLPGEGAAGPRGSLGAGEPIENHVLLSPQTQVTPRYDAPPQPSRPLLWGGGRRGARPPWSPQRQRRPVSFPSQHRERLLYGRSSRGKRIPKGTGSVVAKCAGSCQTEEGGGASLKSPPPAAALSIADKQSGVIWSQGGGGPRVSYSRTPSSFLCCTPSFPHQSPRVFGSGKCRGRRCTAI